VPADRQHRDVRRVDAPDQLHVAEDARVAGEVDLLAVLELHDDACGLAEVVAVVGRARVESVHERELDPFGLDRPAFVRARYVVRLRAFVLEPALELDHRHDRHGAVLLAEIDHRADMVPVPVRRRNHIATVGILLRVGALRVVEPGIDVDTLAAGRIQAEGGVP
jgi:hypothetical protein